MGSSDSGMKKMSISDLRNRRCHRSFTDTNVSLALGVVKALDKDLKERERTEHIPKRKKSIEELQVTPGKKFILFGGVVTIVEVLLDGCVRVEEREKGRFPAQFLEPI